MKDQTEVAPAEKAAPTKEAPEETVEVEHGIASSSHKTPSFCSATTESPLLWRKMVQSTAKNFACLEAPFRWTNMH